MLDEMKGPVKEVLRNSSQVAKIHKSEENALGLVA